MLIPVVDGNFDPRAPQACFPGPCIAGPDSGIPVSVSTSGPPASTVQQQEGGGGGGQTSDNGACNCATPNPPTACSCQMSYNTTFHTTTVVTTTIQRHASTSTECVSNCDGQSPVLSRPKGTCAIRRSKCQSVCKVGNRAACYEECINEADRCALAAQQRALIRLRTYQKKK